MLKFFSAATFLAGVLLAAVFGAVLFSSNPASACVEAVGLPDTVSACINDTKIITDNYNCKDCCMANGNSYWGCPESCGGAMAGGSCDPSSCEWHAEVGLTRTQLYCPGTNCGTPCVPNTVAGCTASCVSYGEVLRVQCPPVAPSMVSTTVRIAGVKNGTSALKIRKGSDTYGIELVAVGASNASCVQIKMPGATVSQALRKCNTTDTVCS